MCVCVCVAVAGGGLLSISLLPNGDWEPQKHRPLPGLDRLRGIPGEGQAGDSPVSCFFTILQQTQTSTNSRHFQEDRHSFQPLGAASCLGSWARLAPVTRGDKTPGGASRRSKAVPALPQASIPPHCPRTAPVLPIPVWQTRALDQVRSCHQNHSITPRV